jgi:hypothetical protein
MKKPLPNRKTSVRIWTPLLEKFTQRLDEACLRRDAWLTQVLERELAELEAVGTIKKFSFDEIIPERDRINSEAARQFIAARLDALPRKLVTFTLPEALIRRLDTLCESKRIVRDSFFNRLIFLLVAHEEHITHLFFDDDRQWKTLILEQTDLLSDAAEHFGMRIPVPRDPFCAIRTACSIEEWVNPNDPNELYDNPWFGPDPIYTVPITAETFPGIDLSGLNVYLSDKHLPTGTPDGPAISLDDLLSDSKSAAAGKNTRHAKKQMQRRGISEAEINLLLMYGSVNHDHLGAELYHFDKAARRRLARDWGPAAARRLDGLHRTYAVSDTDGRLITAGHRYNRIRRDRSRADRWPSRRAYRHAPLLRVQPMERRSLSSAAAGS